MTRQETAKKEIGEKFEELKKNEPEEPEDTGTPLSAAKIPETVGKGPEYYCHANLPDEVWLKRVTAYRSFIDLKF